MVLVLVAPLLWHVLLGILWAVPLRSGAQRSLLIAAERCFAWSVRATHPSLSPPTYLPCNSSAMWFPPLYPPPPYPPRLYLPRLHSPWMHHTYSAPTPTVQALDVFVLTIVAGLAQLGQYARFMLGGECGRLDALLAAHFSDLLPGPPTPPPDVY